MKKISKQSQLFINNPIQGKLAVVTNVSADDKIWFCGRVECDVICIQFHKKYKTGLLEDTLHTPTELYCDVKNGWYDYKSKKAKKYGLLDSNNGGSFSAFFDKKKTRSIFKLLRENGYIIVDQRVKVDTVNIDEQQAKANQYLFG
jgi:hypothetical protein